MREWLRRLLGRTKLERIEGLQHALSQQLVEGQRALSQQLVEGQDRRRHEIVQHFDQMLQATSAAIVSRLGAEGGQRVATIANEIVQIEHRLLVAVQEHRQQMLALTNRIEQLERGLMERDQLRQRLADENARVRELADQTNHLLTELGTERQALHDLRACAATENAVRESLEADAKELRAVRGERDALRGRTDTFESARVAAERARDALQAELERVTRQRDDLLRNDQRREGAAGASS